jgi:hypothetical protein
MTILRAESAAKRTESSAPESYTHPTASTFKLRPPKKPTAKKREKPIVSHQTTIQRNLAYLDFKGPSRFVSVSRSPDKKKFKILI